MTGFVYFLRCGDFVKIGYSSKPTARLAALRTATPHESELIAKFPGTISHEKAVHRCLQHLHHRREWFRFTQEVTALISEGLPHLDTTLDMDSIESLFAQFDGPKGIARVIGKGHSTASEMKRRRSIPVEYWRMLIESEKGQEIGLTTDDLMIAHTMPAPETAGAPA